MTRPMFRWTVLCLVLAATAALPANVSQRASTTPVSIPFEVPGRHVILQVTVNNSRPLSFILDTGATAAIIRADVAKELKLDLHDEVIAGGAGPGTQTGYRVRDAKWSLVGLPGFSQPITMALPLPALSPAMGRWIDGIIGGEFIRQFVVELDYARKQLRLHNAATFTYAGSGESVPIEFVSGSQPTISATVTAKGGKPVERRFLFDIGAGQALTLHSPFVRDQKILNGDLQTIRAIGGRGAGGATSGRLGRVESLKIGSFTLPQPITLFSQDEAGSFANAELAGNLGAAIAMRFRIYMDYGRRRLIFEPTASFSAPFDRAYAGVALRASGSDFRTFSVTDVLENSPASAAGLTVGDVVTAIDGVPAAQLTLPAINQMLEKPVKYSLTIRRGDRTLTVSITPARLI